MSPQSQTFSPEYNPPENKSPHEFDGLGFYRLRKMAGKENKHLFVTVSPDLLTWVCGRNSRPGRFFADTVIKMVLIELLREWDLLLADPAKSNTETVRKVRELFIVAPKTAEVELRRRKM
ncbi:hypothetical protein BP6252_13178 [Coleophoma cylindrospora]|uniref:Uncharacterized protein n=1 Tax=Coleophoma cylindrospora TaxID=1849047 RepID=A0A3D8QA30_9HELO|nr:hypothetical protein BP6252_13178 [Coleophoma cylindrospora]